MAVQILAWGPSGPNGHSNQSNGSILDVVMAALKLGNVGHMSLSLTVYANKIDIKRLQAEHPGLEFEKAPPIPEKIILSRQKHKSKEVTIYGRGKLIEGISVTNSFWPGKRLGMKRALASLFRVGGQVPGLFNSITDDKIAEADREDRLIHHHVNLKNKGKSNRENRYWDLINKQSAIIHRKSQLNRHLNNTRGQYFKQMQEQSKQYYTPHNLSRIKDGIDYGFIDALMSRAKKLNKAKSKYESQLEKLVRELINKNINSSLNRGLKKLLTDIEALKRSKNILPQNRGTFFDAEIQTLETKIAISYLELINKLKGERRTLLMGQQIEKMLTQVTDVEADLDSLNAVIKGLTHLQNQIIEMEHEKHEINDELNVIQQEVEQLDFEINEYEKSPGKNPDIEITLPTSESGEVYYIDEELILDQMERQRKNAQYDLLGENCARSVKNCLIAGIHEETKQAILNLPNVPKNFFAQCFAEIPFEVQQWAMDLSKYLNQLNVNFEQKRHLTRKI